MDLNNEAIQEMDRDPCIFREERYDVQLDTYEHTCSLTTIRVAEGHPRHSKECDPTSCPIWKTYVIQLTHIKR